MKKSTGLVLHSRFVLFGFLVSFCSLLGQTFFFSLFNTSIRADFGLSHGDFGLLYFWGTIASASVVAFAGGYLDKIRLQYWTLMIIAGLFTACLVFTTAQNLIVLTIGIFMLRFFGQGMMSHTSSASMARYFDAFRGRALAIAGFGEPTYTVLMPILIGALLVHYDWRFIWISVAAIMCLTMAIMVPILLGKARVFGELSVENTQKTNKK